MLATTITTVALWTLTHVQFLGSTTELGSYTTEWECWTQTHVMKPAEPGEFRCEQRVYTVTAQPEEPAPEMGPVAQKIVLRKII